MNNYHQARRCCYRFSRLCRTISRKIWCLDPNHWNATDNDDFTYWCLSYSVYGLGDAGTPGSMNDTCQINSVRPLVRNHNLIVTAIGHQLRVLFPGEIQEQDWEIADVTGKIILSGSAFQKELFISLGEMSQGIYFFRLSKLISLVGDHPLVANSGRTDDDVAHGASSHGMLACAGIRPPAVGYDEPPISGPDDKTYGRCFHAASRRSSAARPAIVNRGPAAQPRVKPYSSVSVARAARRVRDNSRSLLKPM